MPPAGLGQASIDLVRLVRFISFFFLFGNFPVSVSKVNLWCSLEIKSCLRWAEISCAGIFLQPKPIFRCRQFFVKCIVATMKQIFALVRKIKVKP